MDQLKESGGLWFDINFHHKLHGFPSSFLHSVLSALILEGHIVVDRSLLPARMDSGVAQVLCQALQSCLKLSCSVVSCNSSTLVHDLYHSPPSLHATPTKSTNLREHTTRPILLSQLNVMPDYSQDEKTEFDSFGPDDLDEKMPLMSSDLDLPPLSSTTASLQTGLKSVSFSAPRNSVLFARSSLADSAPVDSPVLPNILLLHDLDLAPATTQVAVMEALRSRMISIDGKKYDLPSPFLLICTHRERSDDLHPLPRDLMEQFLLELQLDQRLLTALIHYTRSQTDPEQAVNIRDRLSFLRREAGEVHVSVSIAQYIRDIIVAIRQQPQMAIGPSPTASSALKSVARVHAMLCGEAAVRPLDVDSVAVDVLCHSVLLRYVYSHDFARKLIGHLIFNVLLPPK
eukprot:TRINITY_DN11160_c0_g1_i2.p1 TRINITY_DN11160_c0_g1~~TRINITY_DN11160_c0_g1_i2.p1  ORF type:complete len:401 (+),score=63.70 TRINITY_DN11160_c0_g1_i2:137-1339(+)